MVIITKKSKSKKPVKKRVKVETKKPIRQRVKAKTKKPVKESLLKKKIPKEEVIIRKHILVPQHSKVSQKEKQELLQKYKITLKDIPRISTKDPAIAYMDLTTDDLIKIERPSPTSKTTVFYRRVVK